MWKVGIWRTGISWNGDFLCLLSGCFGCGIYYYRKWRRCGVVYSSFMSGWRDLIRVLGNIRGWITFLCSVSFGVCLFLLCEVFY